MYRCPSAADAHFVISQPTQSPLTREATSIASRACPDMGSGGEWSVPLRPRNQMVMRTMQNSTRTPSLSDTLAERVA